MVLEGRPGGSTTHCKTYCASIFQTRHNDWRVNDLMPQQLVGNYRSTWQVRPLLFSGFFFSRKLTQRADTTATLLYSDWWFEGEILETCPKHRLSLPNQKRKEKIEKSSPLNQSSPSAWHARWSISHFLLYFPHVSFWYRAAECL